MPANTLNEQLVKYLTDVHAMEVQALAQMRAAPKLAGDPELASAFEAHREETEGHETLIRERREFQNGKPRRLEALPGPRSGEGLRGLHGRPPGPRRQALTQRLLQAPRGH